MRVRLVRPLIAEIFQLDTSATEAFDPIGPATSGYDPDFKETVLAAPTGGIGTDQRQEKAPIQVPAQVEFGPFEALKQSFSGNLPNAKVVLVFDTDDLLELGLVDPVSNETLLRTSDRVGRILSGCGDPIEVFPDPPGLFITSLPSRYGLNQDRNLLLAFCDDREQGLERAN